MIKFKDNYKTGIPVIDAQHQELFSIVNRMEIGILEQNVTLLMSILDEIIKYTKYHFITEEVFLADIDYERLERHKALHRNMQAEVLEFKHRIESSENPLPLFVDLFDASKNWLIDHVLNEDCIIKEISHLY